MTQRRAKSMQHDHWTNHQKRDNVALGKTENESRIILPGHGGNDDVNVFITSRLKMRIIVNAIWLQQCSECIFLCELTKLWQFLMLMRRQSTADDEKFTRWKIYTSIAFSQPCAVLRTA